MISRFQRPRRRPGCSIRTRWRRRIPESAITRPFPFNAYYSEDEAPDVDGDKLPARGRRPRRQQEAVDAGGALRAAAGLADHPPCLRRGLERDRLLAGRAAVAISCKRIGADTRAKYVWFQCAEGYSNTIDMPTALHPQTQLTLKFDDQILPRKYGFPMKMPHPDQARLQESQIRHRDVGAEQRRRRLLGGPGLQLVQRALRKSLAARRVGKIADRDRRACTDPVGDFAHAAGRNAWHCARAVGDLYPRAEWAQCPPYWLADVCQNYRGVYGLKTSTPKSLKSLTFRVTICSPCTRAVRRSSRPRSDRRERLCMSLAHMRNVAASIGRTFHICKTRSTHASISAAFLCILFARDLDAGLEFAERHCRDVKVAFGDRAQPRHDRTMRPPFPQFGYDIGFEQVHRRLGEGARTRRRFLPRGGICKSNRRRWLTEGP